MCVGGVQIDELEQSRDLVSDCRSPVCVFGSPLLLSSGIYPSTVKQCAVAVGSVHALNLNDEIFIRFRFKEGTSLS